jgi:hypothetical protein
MENVLNEFLGKIDQATSTAELDDIDGEAGRVYISGKKWLNRVEFLKIQRRIEKCRVEITRGEGV